MLNFLCSKKQQVVVNGQSLSWHNVNAGVPKDYIMGPLFFIYKSNLWDWLHQNHKFYDDNATHFSKINDIETSESTQDNALFNGK